MKTIYLRFLLLFLFAACTPEEKDIVEEPVLNSHVSRANVSPSNPFNPYDEVGAVYGDLMAIYYDKDSVVTELDSLLHSVETIAFSLPAFSTVSSTYVSPTVSAIDSILAAPNDRLAACIMDSSLSLAAQLRLTAFANTALVYALDSSEYHVFYDHATAFELEVQSDFGYTAFDKQVLLTSSAIFRYTVYAKKKKPKKNTDPEWDLMVGNFTGAIEGAKVGKGTAVVFALVTGIAENDL
ncbi:hypothetical protein [Flavobacterium lacus]|uniref:Uncharacterized protein n=1 Tax=Flavobacterium lacus TaxID=1353778 RepID=A0A328WJR2_9FLAO|nr:hypothetical protein [Flavobacterium lacus]RAR46463.1 hypothetical protein B0I10_11922 [Flavobacterium lacus]